MNTMELIKKAYAKAPVKQEFRIPVEGQELDVALEYKDFLAINDATDDLYQDYFCQFAAKGQDKIKPSESKIDEFYNSLPEKVQENERKNPPTSVADLRAKVKARQNLLFYLLPQFLVEQHTGKKVCPTERDAEEFRKLLYSNLDLTNILLTNFNLLWQKVNEVNEQAKNSQTPVTSESSN